MRFLLIAAVVFVATAACTSSGRNLPDGLAGIDPEFSEYWYQGKAEICSYRLTQARYGEYRKGEAVLVFVTEDLSVDKHVKTDNPEMPHESVLKLNFTKNFITGIYPYSMMMSVFTPVDESKKTLRVSSSSQEWCGHTFTLLDWTKGKYKIVSHSYFPGEADEEMSVDDVMMEDEIWTRIRIAPDKLPKGKLKIIPATFYSRLLHQELAPMDAIATLEKVQATRDLPDAWKYTIEYQGWERSISISFDREFPFLIRSWEEKYRSDFGENAMPMVTRGEMLNHSNLDYWKRNSNSDSAYRKELLLTD